MTVVANAYPTPARIKLAQNDGVPGGRGVDRCEALTRTTTVKSRKELKRAYQQQAKRAGVFQIKNSVNGKVLLGSSLNLDGPLNFHKFALSRGRHRNRGLQAEWNTYGPDTFVFEILDVVKVTDDPHFNLETELTLLEQIWMEQLQPIGEGGYNTDARIRQV